MTIYRLDETEFNERQTIEKFGISDLSDIEEAICIEKERNK